MNLVQDTVARAIARGQGRAFVVRDSYALAPDPALSFGVAPIKLVAEEMVQAIAFGLLNRPPKVVVTWNPLSRESQHLDEFAGSLNNYLQTVLSAEALPRIWVPHVAALTLIELLGHRYRTNKAASDALRQMGHQCRTIADEAKFAGQQVVAVATQQLLTHVVTGGAPVKEHHLGALLAWVDPQAGSDPATVAEERALVPASAMLVRAADDKVESLRNVVKKGGRDVARARTEIETILADGALAEWNWLVQARGAFWGLGLTNPSSLDRLIDESRGRFVFAVSTPRNLPSRVHTLSNLLDNHEFALELAEDAAFRSDARVRNQARSEGRVVDAEVLVVLQPKPNQHPCTLVLRTEQPVLRVRKGTALSLVDGSAAGRVMAIAPETGGTGTLVRLEVRKGVQRSRCPVPGARRDWVDTEPLDLRKRRREAYAAMQLANSPMVYETELPAAMPRPGAADLMSVIDQLRS